MPSVWDNFEPGRLTLCSPDPQAIRPPGEKINVLQVTLPTNFKVARFDSDEHDRDPAPDGKGHRRGPLQPRRRPDRAAGQAARCTTSIFVPLAKWAMLLTGNYRCVTKDGAIDIKDAVHRDHRGLALGLQLGVRRVREARRLGQRPRAVREIRRRGATIWCGRLRRRGRLTTACRISSAPTGWCS